MSIIGGILPLILIASALPAQQQQAPADQAAAIRRIAAMAQLAAQEYRLGVADGRIVAPPEVEEARLFLREARQAAGALPADTNGTTARQLDSLIALVDQIASPDTLAARVRGLAGDLTSRFGVVLDELPAQPPSLARGAEVYRADCAGCHGNAGRGDGPMGVGLDPPPANLTDAEALRDQSLLDFYRRITIGVVGTAMPSFESRLSADDRWAVAFYASTLRGPAPIFAQVRDQVDSAYAMARRNDPAAPARALDAYMMFEQVERSVRTKNPTLATELEAAFADLRTYAAGGSSRAAELDAARTRLAAGLENAERALTDRPSAAALFTQSFVILVREGLEAILIVGALLTFLAKMGAAHRRRDVHLGIGAAVVASLLTALALETVFHLTPAKQEVLEGITMLVATVVLFYVSYWLLSKMEVVRWNDFVKSKVQDALSSGSSLALASAAFLAVYREGFETVLFYKALFLTAGPGAEAMPVVGGMLAGAVLMVVVYFAIYRFGVRLPFKPFFGVTSAFLYYMAFMFAGQGIAELQEGGLISTTLVSWAPRVAALGIYPTAESLAAQGVLVVLLTAALVWTFVVAPRRARSRSRIEEPAAASRVG